MKLVKINNNAFFSYPQYLNICLELTKNNPAQTTSNSVEHYEKSRIKHYREFKNWKLFNGSRGPSLRLLSEESTKIEKNWGSHYYLLQGGQKYTPELKYKLEELTNLIFESKSKFYKYKLIRQMALLGYIKKNVRKSKTPCC